MNMYWYKIAIKYDFGDKMLKYFIVSQYSNINDVIIYDLKDRLGDFKNITGFKIKLASSCEGCRHNLANQEGHMGNGGCLEN